MAQISLVDRRIEDGEALMHTLSQSGFGVAAAAWVRAHPDEGWELWIATPGIDQLGKRDAYLLIQGEIRAKPEWAIGLLDVKLVDSTNGLGKELVEMAHRQPPKPTVCYGILGDMEIQEAYVYPAVQP